MHREPGFEHYYRCSAIHANNGDGTDKSRFLEDHLIHGSVNSIGTGGLKRSSFQPSELMNRKHPHLCNNAPSDKKEEHIYAGNKAMNLTMEERYPMKHGSKEAAVNIAVIPKGPHCTN
ncbi:hypothetical protein DPMN_132412 [Dreissena polymorpha]|uniref:Uncharacterized protein n=1 Tax=Dreissena polymorpha TaxID=45954 RepID=A0A9D4FSF9_DREPO|nr:hypothetical protein DPMN_132412 [Dreissena polymorpha]